MSDLNKQQFLSCGPYEYRPAKFQLSVQRGYWVRIYLMFDGSSAHFFWNSSDLYDNSLMAHDLGISVSVWCKHILVTETDYFDIFKYIDSHVSRSDIDRQSEL